MFIHSNITEKRRFRAVRAICKGDNPELPCYVCEDITEGITYRTTNLADINIVRDLADVDKDWIANHPETFLVPVQVEILYTSTVTETK